MGEFHEICVVSRIWTEKSWLQCGSYSYTAREVRLSDLHC